jgi:CheY-like chemotaxis protein
MSEEKHYILYVDDSEDDVIMARRAFKKSNLATDIVTLTDGQECIDYIFAEGDFQGEHHNLPMVILLDLNMPRVDGFEVLEYLRSHEVTKNIPIVVLTTSDAQNDISKAYELGANSFITKPLKTEDFFSTIVDINMYWSVHNKIKSE